MYLITLKASYPVTIDVVTNGQLKSVTLLHKFDMTKSDRMTDKMIDLERIGHIIIAELPTALPKTPSVVSNKIDKIVEEVKDKKVENKNPTEEVVCEDDIEKDSKDFKLEKVKYTKKRDTKKNFKNIKKEDEE